MNDDQQKQDEGKKKNEALAGKHLAAKFARLCRNNLLPADGFDKFILRWRGGRTRHKGRLIIFSGAFSDGERHTLPFVVYFDTNSSGDSQAGLHQLAIATPLRHRERVLAFLSIIECLVITGSLPEDALESHIRHITMRGPSKEERTSFCTEFSDFSIRAAKDLPYDLSLEVLELIGHKVAA